VLSVPLKWWVLLRDLSNLSAAQFILGLGTGMLRLGIALVAEVSWYIASRCHRQYVCLRSSQAPRMLMYADPVSGELRLERTPSVVWQSCFAAAVHLLQRYERYGRRSRQALDAQ
jgi:hypothetical protein